MRSLYIRLRGDEMGILVEYAEQDRRTPQEQAAHLVSRGLADWQAQRLFESTFAPTADEDDDLIEAGAA